MADENQEFKLPEAEEQILKFWENTHIFEKTLAARKGKKEFVFYEGPPYANGRPGIHHVLARVFKDIILRYKSMRGYYVPRKAGWDTHGLPVEIAAEKALGLKSKKEIEKFGIAHFNAEAKKAVWTYKDEWEKMTRRIGYWLDLEHAYVTYTKNYIETIWWTLKQIANRRLLYKGHKVVPWCTRCGTALSSHELAQGYKEVVDTSVYVKFRLKNVGGLKFDVGQKALRQAQGKIEHNVYVLSWTTTPWTLPGNVALAVGNTIAYAIVKTNNEQRTTNNGEFYIVAKERLDNVMGVGNYEIVAECKGKDLVGLEYEPLFSVPALAKPRKAISSPRGRGKAYKIYPADFVTTTDGTGVVHTAVMYGEDDYNLGKAVGLPQHHTVDEMGKFTKDLVGFAGLYVKAKETEEKVIAYLSEKNLLFKTEQYTHEYPHCWRCGTPVIYYARTSWFIAMSRLRNKLLENNETVNWIPSHVKEGRFGEWLREVKDWNLSRERYWGAPLPIWECKKCGSTEVIGGLKELSLRAGGAKNEYWVMRHGEAENNIFHIINSKAGAYHLTPKGESEVDRSAKALLDALKKSKKKIDVVISSDLTRTAETAKRAASILGVKRVVLNKQLREIQLGELSGCHDTKYHELYPTYRDKFERTPPGGESLRDLRARMWHVLQNLEKKYKGKRILLVSHEYPIWMLQHAARAWDEDEAIAEKERRGEDFVATAAIESLPLMIVPRNDTGEVDLHRPYADTISIPCSKCKSTMFRVKEVADVWYDSGAMPFAQAHWPFGQRSEKKEARRKENTKLQIANLAYPADYIAEGMDQTRGWFYTLLAIATALGYEAPYKHVVSLGLINDKFGQKMSKSKGNIVDPWGVIQKYGVDAVRWYFYTMNPPGEPKNFDETELSKTYRRFHLILWNSLVFWKTYASKKAESVRGSMIDVGRKISNPEYRTPNILDQWILARLNETIVETTENLENYNIREAALSIEQLVDDLSRWYIRRSRRRLQKPSSPSDFQAASETLGYVLREITKLIAPFTPFFAEKLFGELGHATSDMGQGKTKSVHLEDWPTREERSEKKEERKILLEGMEEVRRVAALGLAKRAEAGIKVRQPLARLMVCANGQSLMANSQFLEILKDEVNVKEIVFDANLDNEIELDTTITPELKEEGTVRDLVRMVSEFRGKANLKPQDKIALMIECGELVSDVIERNEGALKKEVGAKTVEYKKTSRFDAEMDGKLDDQPIWIGLEKV